MEIVNDDMNVPSTTSLENNNKMMVQENMQVLSPSTMIPVNDVLLSTIKNVDYLYYLEKGKIIEEGSYKMLKEDTNSKFYKLTKLQKL